MFVHVKDSEVTRGKHYLSRDRDLVFGPLAGEVDADAGDDCGRVAQAHGGQVQRVGRHEVRGLSELFRCWNKRHEIALARPIIAINRTQDIISTIHQPRARTSARTFDQLTALDHMGVRVVDGNVKAKGLEQDVLVAHQLLGLQVELKM